MHECPDCGQACYCHGDIDNCVVETEEYVFENCTCCNEFESKENDDNEFCPFCEGIATDSKQCTCGYVDAYEQSVGNKKPNAVA